jgi:hypothetical protein
MHLWQRYVVLVDGRTPRGYFCRALRSRAKFIADPASTLANLQNVGGGGTIMQVKMGKTMSVRTAVTHKLMTIQSHISRLYRFVQFQKSECEIITVIHADSQK